MAQPLIECVPNFSEGRDAKIVEAIEQAIRSVSGVTLLRSEMDPDHNRSVITFAGAPEAVAEGALCGIAAAVERIDLRQHQGVHPRIGAGDVVPFVPLQGATLEDCAAIAHRVGETVWKKLGVPVYFYEAAATSPERAPLENIRRGGLAPDLGGPAMHPTAGASAIGARKILIAFNVNLATQDLSIAQAIARKIRASSGGLPFVKALGVPLPSQNLVQVSMNLTDFERTSLRQVYEVICKEVSVPIASTQIVGLIPQQAAEGCNFVLPNQILENQLTEPRP